MKGLMISGLLFLLTLAGCSQGMDSGNSGNNFRQLSSFEKWVIVDKGTEPAFSGKYYDFWGEGTYVCKRCGSPLYRSSDKFDAGCGWPSFDDEIPGAVKRTPDPDGMRTEISCAACGAHLGHVFLNEGFTSKNTRHCVNSASMVFMPATNKQESSADTAYFAGGCFWGVEYFMQQEPGVISAVSGYMGGNMKNPSYEDVSSHRTGHAETVRVIFDPSKTDYEQIARLFFDIHDPTQVNRQGPDIGTQYRSEVFFTNKQQERIAEALIDILKTRGYRVATIVSPASTFWTAEEYHQDHYFRTGGTPYCHMKVDRFGD